MSRRKKLLETIRARPVEAEYHDVEALLQDFGWKRNRESGSHVIFAKAGELPITVPKKGGRKVKRVYLTLICERLGLDEINLDDLED